MVRVLPTVLIVAIVFIGTAVVTFDDAKTDVAALTKATAGVGFSSKLVE